MASAITGMLQLTARKVKASVRKTTAATKLDSERVYGGLTMKRKWLRALPLLLFLAVAACGGGGGDGGGGAPPPASTACVWGSSNWDACNWQ